MKILIIEMSNLGDAILTYPALQALWDAYPDAEFHLVAPPRVFDLFKGEPRIQKVIRFQRKALPLQVPFVLSLMLQRYDAVVDFRHTIIPLFLIGSKHSPVFRRPRATHRVDRHLELVKALGIPASPRFGSMPYGSDEEREVRHWLEPDKKVVVISPGSRSHLKRWPARRFAEVADRLIEERNAQVLLVGDQRDRESTDAVRRGMRHEATDLAGHTTVRQMFALLAKANLVLTNDSATLHAAQAMNAPTVVVFGPTDERKYGPRNADSSVVRLSMVCAPCEKPLCPYGHECMQMLPTSDVWSTVSRTLSS